MLCSTDLTKVGLITIAASSVCTRWQINFQKKLDILENINLQIEVTIIFKSHTI